MSRVIDLSCDLGEAREDAERAIETAIWPMISAANVACGGHVGDARSMREALERCVEFDVTLGAHPSYPDPEGFGRRHVDMTHDALVCSLSSQIEALKEIALECAREIERVKPHGALYNEAQRDRARADAVVESVVRTLPRAAVVCAGGSEIDCAARGAGLAVVREAFVDRRYMPDGSLQPRSEPGSLLLDPEESAAQALRLADSGCVVATDGSSVAVPFETLCAHSDMQGSVERISLVVARLAAAGFRLRESR